MPSQVSLEANAWSQEAATARDESRNPVRQQKKVLEDGGNDATDHDFKTVSSRKQNTSNVEIEGSWWRKPERPALDRDSYSVGWICALPIELAASHAMLDDLHPSHQTIPDDPNAYILGNIGQHNIVMACLPSGQYGTNWAAKVGINMKRTFRSIKFGFMVGIGGGVPGTVDIRLGDVVVGQEVVQHDMGKITAGGELQSTGPSTRPPEHLLYAISRLRAIHERTKSWMPSILGSMQERYPELKQYATPPPCEDRLCISTYEHDKGTDDNYCTFEPRTRDYNNPEIHYGTIASGNQVIKCGRARDRLAKERNALCFEMEAAGLMDSFPCLVIRGICDYADSHKHKEWQKYAAGTAAAYAKVFINNLTSETNSSLKKFPDNSATVAQTILHERRENLMKLLRFPDMNARYGNVETKLDDTGTWILQSESYKTWIAPGGQERRPGFFCVSGKPGSGKSTIMKSAVTEASKTNVVVTHFFFNARGQDLEKTTFGLYRCLLFQILEKLPDLQEILDDTVLLPSSLTSCPAIDTVRSLLRRAVNALNGRTLACFIDALDECDEDQIEAMVTYFDGLETDALRNNIELKVCFSSRHYPPVDIPCNEKRRDFKLVLEGESGHTQDLEKYVQKTLRHAGNPLGHKIRTRILEKCEGVFLWVVLVVPILNKYLSSGMASLKRAEKRLDELPKGLEKLFEDIIKRDNENMVDLLLCIQWVLFSKRPLRPDEFYYAMLAGSPDFDEEEMEHDADTVTKERMWLRVTRSSKGLAEIVKHPTPSVQFIHESVREFLVKQNGLRSFWPEMAENLEMISHRTLRDCCHIQITATMVGQVEATATLLPPKKSPTDAHKAMRLALNKYPFQEYAISSVLHHSNVIADSLPQDEFLDQFPLKDWIYFANILEQQADRRYTPTVTLTYILAERNFPRLLGTYIRRHPEAHLRGERRGYPIFAAMANRNWAAARTILGSEADAFSDEELFPSMNPGYGLLLPDEPVNITPPQWASEKKQYVLFRLLAGPDYSDPQGRSLLHLAVAGGDEVSVRALVERDAIVSYQQGLNETHRPLATGSSPDEHARISPMWKNGYIDAKDHLGHSPLSIAIRDKHDSIVRLLVELGATLNDTLTNNWGRLSLASFAIRNGGYNWELAKLLVDRGIVTKQTLFSIAVARGFKHVVDALLEDGGVSVHAVDENGRTPLEQSAIYGHEPIAQVLIERGADIDRQNQHGSTPLHQAAVSGYKTIAKLLVNRGASVNHADGDGQTPLHRASFLGRTEIVALLISAGARLDHRDRRGQTALHIAAIRGHADVADVLVRGGASPH
ncbi:hypothetical protein CGLO_14452 [Colletotrichum gloeosporioides Cg-14]|uniref:Uncharacterized protein n=1 Tax=Colletotrichum gloeosporioides (strain Cg-14) TaxID=1237896 RepID=T0K3Y8_COLGC|nr:hypothetical protein CGLO_14452 [Colletotrichum gloeosporioides Cg-14]